MRVRRKRVLLELLRFTGCLLGARARARVRARARARVRVRVRSVWPATVVPGFRPTGTFTPITQSLAHTRLRCTPGARPCARTLRERVQI